MRARWAGIPGLILLARFVPLGARDPTFEIRDLPPRTNISRPRLMIAAAAGGLIGTALALLVIATLSALSAATANPDLPFNFPTALNTLLHPTTIQDYLPLLGALVFGTISALLTAAITSARRH